MASSYFSLISLELYRLRCKFFNGAKQDEDRLYDVFDDINSHNAEEHDEEDELYNEFDDINSHNAAKQGEDQLYDEFDDVNSHNAEEHDEEDEMYNEFDDVNIHKTEEHDEDQATTKLHLYDFDIEILKMFCLCFEAWESCTNDEQRKESYRSMITHLKLIWVEEEQDNNLETWPQQFQDFDPITFGLEGKIEQSKTQIEQWCQILIYSFSMQCKSSSEHNFSEFLDCVIDNMYGSAAKIVEKLKFLSDSFYRVRECENSKELLLQYIKFVHEFFNNAACLLCLYWANEEIANIAPFDILHKIKPFAADVTACYFSVLKSNNVIIEEYEIQIPAGFVDFFFEHTVLMADFLILRERLIVLFTFLIDPPHENDNEEEEVIFREDAYLLLPISDFMNKIDVLIDKVIRFYCRPSDSWYRLEAEKMNNILFASLQRELFSSTHLMEIRFLRMFFQCFETWDESDEETMERLTSVITSLRRIWEQEYDMELISDCLYAMRYSFEDREDLDLKLKEKLQTSKQEINAWLVSLSHCSFHCRPSTSNKILKFLDSILYNMSDLITYGACKDAALNKQIEILEEKLLHLKNFFILATNHADNRKLEEFNMLAQVCANSAACLIYLYWTEGQNYELPAITNLMLTNMLQKIKPDTPDVARMYVGTLKAICLQPYDSLLLEQTAMSFVDYFFEDLVTPWKNDFQILRDEVMFNLTFVHHHHHHSNGGEIISRQFDVLFSDGVYDLLPFDNTMKGGFSKKKDGLSDSMMNIGKENAKIRQLYCKFPDSFLYNFPKIIGHGFMDCLIQKLRNLTERLISDQKYVPFAEYKIKTIEEKLLSLTPIFNQRWELKDLNDVWLEVVNVLYLAEHVISMCFIFYHLIWHYIPYLSDVVDRIKVVMAKLEKIKECNMYNNSRSIPHSVGLMRTLLEQDWNSEMVGFEVDEKIIIDNITRGTESLDTISIVGMGGLGKTTLAKKIYDSSLVKSYFNIFAFTYVSQDHDKRRLLLDILRNITGDDAETSRMTDDDLAHKLKKCLSRRKYFVVLDDIWNINAWDEVKRSFPDDRNGSRVMFTTRSLEVARRVQIKCSPHRLRFLTEDESWKLLQKKVFHNDMPPPNLSGVAKLIAKKCNGLPLSIVVIAGLLARTETSLWIEISKGVSSYLYNEGCMNILELSYKHLPEYLKPCLLYLGAFPAYSTYRVNEVILLWIDEGFIKESKTKSLNNVAKDYLYELFDRSLIIVDKMTIGEIRTFNVHDLIHDLCQKKCQDENFFQVGHGIATSSSSSPSIYNKYRVSMQKQCDITELSNIRSLLYIPSRMDYPHLIFSLRKFRFAQMLYLEGIFLQESDFKQLSSIDLRHIEVGVDSEVHSIPLSVSNIWNMQSLILKKEYHEEIYLPETLWRMKSLRYVKVNNCKFEIPDGCELNEYPKLDKVVSFSSPCLSTGKDVEWLLQRLPVVRKLGCNLINKSLDSTEERVVTLDFHRKLESLKLWCKNDGPYSINFPSTLIKLTLGVFKLSWTAILEIAKLQCLTILKLKCVSFPGPTWEMEDVTFPNLKYFDLSGSNLELWNANIASFPCLEQLYFENTLLEELPPCFGEISSLKKITVLDSPKLKSSALQIQEEQIDWGNNVELVELLEYK